MTSSSLRLRKNDEEATFFLLTTFTRVLLLEVDVYDASFAGKWPQLCRGPVPCYDLAEISWTDSTYNDRVIIKALFKGEPSYMRIERRNITSYPQLDFVIKMKSSSQ
jgi:hypothetical protein